MLTVKQYAESRDVSESSVKNHVRKLGLDLPENPADRRQRLISSEQQAQLDASLGVTPEIVPEVVPYERSEQVGMVLTEHALTIGHADYGYQRPEDNPLYQALQNQVQALNAYNTQAHNALQQQASAYRDADRAIDAIEQMQIVQRARQKAFAHHSLEQQAYHQSLTEMRMASQGLTVPTPPPSPAAQTQQPTASNPEWL